MSDKFDEYRQKVAGTNIDPRSLLSTDYFNTFNSVIMLFDMLPDMPELLDEIDQWRFSDYVGHFRASGLDFADLAIEAYAHSPPDIRQAFERKIRAMHFFVEDVALTLRRLHKTGETENFTRFGRHAVLILHSMVDEGGAIVHGNGGMLDQGAIDQLF